MTISTVVRSVLFLFLLPAAGIAQGSLQGLITDSTQGDPLIGVNVFLKGTALGAVTGIEGKYKIPRIASGRYTVRISYLGYTTRELPVAIEEGKTTVVNVRLSPEIIEGEVVVITAQARGQMAAINQQLTARTIVNVVSEEKIKELSDANAAEAIGRLPGVSLLRSGGEANKVILRGMSDKFTTVTVDGVKIPPTDPDSRGVDLSTLSQGSLSGIELFKALTADKDADAIAGSVNLVTRRAPSERLFQLDLKGDYNNLMRSAKQYDLGLRYGERFFDGMAGLQVIGTLEDRIRSNEATNIQYQDLFNPSRYYISNFKLQFVDEVRKRNGATVLFDFDTPDSGSIRFNTNYNYTNRDYGTYSRNYMTRNAPSTPVFYEMRDRLQDITTFNTALSGENNLFGTTVNWGGSFARSDTKTPFDYYLDYVETIGSLDSTGHPISGMDLPAGFAITDRPEQIIPYAVNNFSVATIDSGIYNTSENRETQTTLFLDLRNRYTLGRAMSGEVKWGGKYKAIARSKHSERLFTPYYLGSWVPKNLMGTRFESFYRRYLANNFIRSPQMSDFLDAVPETRSLFDKYLLNPLMNRQAIHDWYELNKNGTGPANEYYVDNTADLDFYDIDERISAAYIMNTLNISQNVTLIAGLRMEHEQNDYLSRFVPGSGALGGFPTPTGLVKDTTTSYSSTVWLPNFHLTVRPLEFLNLRFAAYKALARPDYNARLIKLYAQSAGPVNNLYVGNPNLRLSQAWNFEVNTSVFSNTLGLISVSAFYKTIKDDIHTLYGGGLVGPRFLDSLGIFWNTSLTRGGYQLTLPYNTTEPTKVWGLEFEHQANLNFLPGYLQFLVLSYNFSIIRSETHIVATRTETTYTPDTTDFGVIMIPSYYNRVIDKKQKLENQPEFFGNVAVGYDIADFSVRLSVYYQGEFNANFSPDERTDGLTGSYTRTDVTMRQKLTPNVALTLAVNNIFDVDETTSSTNRIDNWTRLTGSQRYGRTVDFGVRITF
ncbi:MAG: TonB-dependent receptor domain-containing protein [Acidobacteriota bacterium]